MLKPMSVSVSGSWGEKWCGDKFLERPVSKLRMNVGLGCGYTACKKLRGILAYIEYSNYM